MTGVSEMHLEMLSRPLRGAWIETLRKTLRKQHSVVAPPAWRVDKNKSKYADLQAVEEYSWSGPSIPRYGGALPPKLGVG